MQLEPRAGRSALDAVELTNCRSAFERAHPRRYSDHQRSQPEESSNVVPEFAEVYYYIRHPKSQVARELYARLVKCAQAGALATETKLEIDFQGGIVEILPNNVLAGITLKNLRNLNTWHGIIKKPNLPRVSKTLSLTQFL